MNTNIIEFPNLGLGPWEINRFAVQIGSFRIAWYGIIITFGIMMAVLYAIRRAKKSEPSFTPDDIIDYGLWCVVFGILGARLYYVATTWEKYESFLDIFAIWKGGLAIYGALIAGGLTILCVSLIKGKNPLTFLDIVAPGVILAQAIGRWGNFMNAEAYGSILKYEFLGHEFETSRRAGEAIKWIMKLGSTNYNSDYAHPTFLYESLWCLLGFVVLNLLYRKKKKFEGQIFFAYIVWYGFGRLFIEGFRTDSLYLGNVRISQLVALGCVIFGILFYALLAKRARPILAAKQDKQEYESLFSEKKNDVRKETSVNASEKKLSREEPKQEEEKTEKTAETEAPGETEETK